MKLVLPPLMALSAAGLVLSAVIHLAAWVGMQPPSLAWALHVGIFVVWIPAVFVSQRLTRDFKQSEWWEATYRGAPRWVARGTKWLGAYALANFAIFLFVLPKEGSGETVNTFRGFSGHWMVFYAGALGIFYSALHATDADRARVCPSGHPVAITAKYCGECGAPVERRPTGA